MASSSSKKFAHAPSVQLAFAFIDQPPAESALLPTRALLRHREFKSVLRKVRYVRRFFPELDGRSLKIGLTKVASGMAVAGGNELWLNPSHISYHTIAHELVHLLQGEGGVPSGERSCDVFSMARHWSLNDMAPYYVKIPKSFVDTRGKVRPEASRALFTVARRAVELRAGGLRRYIAYFEKTLEIMAGRPPHQQGLDLPASPLALTDG